VLWDGGGDEKGGREKGKFRKGMMGGGEGGVRGGKSREETGWGHGG